MSKDKTFGLETWKIAVLVAALAGLLAGAYGIYAIDDGNSNPHTARQDDSASQPQPPPSDDDVTLKSLARGKLAAFVVHKTRKPVADIAFTDENGRQRLLSQWRGRVVLVNLWATWCAPCRREMPQLAKLQTMLGSDDFEVVAISVDRKGAKASAKFLVEAKATALRLYVDPSAQVLARIKAVGLPTTLLIDRAGRVIGRLVGPAEWASDDAVRLIRKAIEEGQVKTGDQPAASPVQGISG